MNATDLVSIASEQARGWLAIWRFFAIVILAIFAAIIAASEAQEGQISLPAISYTATFAFTVFAGMHLVTLLRYFKIYETIDSMVGKLDEDAPNERKLIESLAPPKEKRVVIVLYMAFSNIVIWFLLSYGELKMLMVVCLLMLPTLFLFAVWWIVERRY